MILDFGILILDLGLKSEYEREETGFWIGEWKVIFDFGILILDWKMNYELNQGMDGLGVLIIFQRRDLKIFVKTDRHPFVVGSNDRAGQINQG